MISKYLVTLTVTVVLVTFAAASLRFATRSQVLSGKAVDESLRFEFTIDADSSNTYEIGPTTAQFLQTHIGFDTVGPPHVVASSVEVAPKDVSWTQGRSIITSTGAVMAVQLHWDTPAGAANGAHGLIYLDFPSIPGLEGKTASFHSGPYQMDDAGRYVIREVTCYQGAGRLSFARILFALSAGLPFGIVLHTICWAFVLKGEKRSRLSALPRQDGGLPRTFYPDPIVEWIPWLVLLGIGASVVSILAGHSLYEGFVSTFDMTFGYSFLAIAAGAALTVAYFTGKNVLTVRVCSNGIFYARGRGRLLWLNATWSDIRLLTERSSTYRGNTTYWIEIQFNDNRKRLKIGQSIQGYAALRDLLMGVFRP
jgi:hypothetical protein